MLWNCGSLRSFFGSRDPLSLLFLRLAYDRLTYDACRIINIATRRSTLVRLGGSLLGGYLWTYFVLSGANSVYLWILIRREVEIAILKNYEILENFPPWIEKLFQASSRLSTYLRTTVRGRPVLDLWFIYRHFSSLRYRRGRKSRRINRSMAACAITIEIKSKRGKDSLSFLDNSHLASLLSSLFINFLSVSLSLRFSDAETRGGERKPSLCRTGAA